jgi:hypothetical protein
MEAPTTFLHDGVKSQRMIITCEVCKEAFHFDTIDEDNVEITFSNFQCKNKCDRTYYSYITVGKLFIEDMAEEAMIA